MRVQLLVALVIVVVLGACQAGTTSVVVPQTADVTVSGPSLPQHGQPDSAVGAVPPTLDGVSFAGDPVVVDPADGAHVILFVAHWCPHCQNEIPVVVDWVEAGGLPADVQLTVVSTSVREGQPNYPPSDWLTPEGVPLTILLDNADSAAAQAYGLTSFPYVVTIGASGRVVDRVAGELPVVALMELVADLGDA